MRTRLWRPNRLLVLQTTTQTAPLYSVEINSFPQPLHHLSHHHKWVARRGNRCFLLLPQSIINPRLVEILKIPWNSFHWLWPVRRESPHPVSSWMIKCNLSQVWPSSSHLWPSIPQTQQTILLSIRAPGRLPLLHLVASASPVWLFPLHNFLDRGTPILIN